MEHTGFVRIDAGEKQILCGAYPGPKRAPLRMTPLF